VAKLLEHAGPLAQQLRLFLERVLGGLEAAEATGATRPRKT
jgi:hypothetical protein